MILTEATNLRVGTTQSITAALQNSSFAAFWTYLTTTISSVISGSIGLIKNGTGTLILSGNNTYTGNTTVNAGVLNIQNNNALGSVGNGTTISSGAALQLQNDITVTGESLTLSGNGTSNDGAMRNISGNNTWTGAITTSGGALVRIQSDAGRLTLAGNLDYSSTGANALTFSGQGSILVSGNISSSGSGGVTINSASPAAGTLTLTGNNTFTGSLSATSGTISISSIGNVGEASAAGAGNINISSTGSNGVLIYTGSAATSNKVINMAGGDARTMTITQNGTGLLKFTSNLTASAGGNKTLILNGNGTGEIAGAIVNNTGNLTHLTKSGTGTWILSGNNTYTGNTSITGGTLRTTALISGTTGKFSQADFTNTTLTVTFSVAPVAGETYRLLPGATVQTYASVSLVGAPGRTATYNSTNSTLTIA